MASTQGKTALAFARTWHHVSARDRTLGNLASRIAWVLMGKHKPIYDPAVDAGDYVVVTSPLDVHLSGNKATDKVYRSHSGFMGGLKEVPITRMRERRGDDIIRKAVSRMLPKNTFRDRRLDRLKIFNGSLEELEDPSNVHRLSKERAWLSNVKKVVRDEEQVRQ